jgi:thiamine-monophosphate kinase
VIFMEKVPVSLAAFELAKQEGATDAPAAALQHALSDGQDFELLLAVNPKSAQSILHDKPVDCAITHVGELIADPGLWQIANGVRTPLEPTGWRHI